MSLMPGARLMKSVTYGEVNACAGLTRQIQANVLSMSHKSNRDSAMTLLIPPDSELDERIAMEVHKTTA